MNIRHDNVNAGSRTGVITAALALVAIFAMTGCARDGSDRMDTALLRGAEKSKKAIEHKAGAQKAHGQCHLYSGW